MYICFRIRTQTTLVLARKFRVQSLLEIYTAEVRFSRKINFFFKKIPSLKSRDLPYARGKNYWDKYLTAWQRVQADTFNYFNYDERARGFWKSEKGF
jgi:hypothetical protein